MQVACGNCLGCRAEQARQWSVRIMHEAQMHNLSWFVTLTYNDEQISENGSLVAKDFQSFIKSVRRKHKAKSVSYFGCGEYGGRTQRPHYHAVLFGPEFLDRYRDPNPARHNVWRSPSLETFWGRGLVELGTVTQASASYVAGYVRKKLSERDRIRADPSTGELLEPEFARMSLKPALGKRWLEQFWRDVYPRDFVVIDGVEAKPPRYYDKWMDQTHGSLSTCWPNGCDKHRGIMEQVREKRYEEAVDLTEYQLTAKEKIHMSRDALFNGRDQL